MSVFIADRGRCHVCGGTGISGTDTCVTCHGEGIA